MAVPNFQRRDEHEAAFFAYRSAMARTSNAAAFVALARWRERVATLNPGANPAYAASLVQVVWGARRLGRRLTQAWYQFSRALDSGYMLGGSEGGAEGLEGLRAEFYDRLQDAGSLGHGYSDDPETREFERAVMEHDYGSRSGSYNARAEKLDRELVDREIQEFLDKWGEDRELAYEPYQWPTDSDPDDIARYLDRELRRIAREESTARRDKIRRDEDESGERASDERQQDEHMKAGQKVAGEIQRIVSDAADSNIRRAMRNDQRVMSVARGTALRPCSFCAMLASRGFAYGSVATAAVKVHPNCNCYPIIRWKTVSNEQDLPAVNDWYRELWEESTKGLSGSDARNAFRRRLNLEFGDQV